MKSQQEQQLRAQVEQIRERLGGLTAGLRGVDDKVDSLALQRQHHELLDQACGSLEKLDELGAASLFWGGRAESINVTEQLRVVRDRVNKFQGQLDTLEARRQEILTDIDREEENLAILGEDLDEIHEQEERRKSEWIVEREMSRLPLRLQRMAWTRGGDEDRYFYKSLACSLLISVLLGAALPMIDLPLPERFVPEAMPKRIAKLVRPELPKPVAPPPVAADKPEPEPVPEPEPQQESKPQETVPEPIVADAEPAPAKKPGPPGPEGAGMPKQRNVGKAGILAFKNQFASLSKDKVAPRLGADARLGQADDSSQASMATRSMLTTNAPGSSGGINIAGLSRNVGGPGGPGGAGGIQGVQVGRATSGIGGLGGNGDRPLAGGGGGGGQAASRTDEEIQIVFDRYKASFYRLYNRKLRVDPTLRGQMVLRLTIEPDGSVSMCELQSTDMNAPDLASQVVDRVRTINFGAKEGVAALTIVYPIDFLPKA